MEWAREVEAHGRAAAEAILVEKNRDHGSLWVIDLHGLHAQEAVEALASRLALLEEGCAAAVSAGGLSSGMADPAFRRVAERTERWHRRQQHRPKTLLPSLGTQEARIDGHRGEGAPQQRWGGRPS